MAKEAVFAGIERFGKDFTFGVQTNATLLDDEAIAFLKDTGSGSGFPWMHRMPASPINCGRTGTGPGLSMR